MSEQIHIFDRALLRRRRDRAASGFAEHNVLHAEAATVMVERLKDVKRDFACVLDLGAHDGLLTKQLAKTGRMVVTADLSQKMLQQSGVENCVVADEELLPFAPQSFDLIVSNLSLHWINDLPGALAQIRNCLKPDGLFLATLFGGQTLHELRSVLMEAEMVVSGGISPRLSPIIDMQSASALLQRAGFSLPVTDQEFFTLTYPNVFALMRDLRGMGEANTQFGRQRTPSRKQLFSEAERLYRERHGQPDGRIPATFEAIFLHGWR